MTTPEGKADQSPISDRELFENLVKDAKDASSVWNGILESMGRADINPDRMFSIVTRCTVIRPSRLRSIVGGAETWSRWDDFKLSVITDIVEHELEDRAKPPKFPPPSPIP